MCVQVRPLQRANTSRAPASTGANHQAVCNRCWETLTPTSAATTSAVAAPSGRLRTAAPVTCREGRRRATPRQAARSARTVGPTGDGACAPGHLAISGTTADVVVDDGCTRAPFSGSILWTTQPCSRLCQRILDGGRERRQPRGFPAVVRPADFGRPVPGERPSASLLLDPG